MRFVGVEARFGMHREVRKDRDSVQREGWRFAVASSPRLFFELLERQRRHEFSCRQGFMAATA